MRNELGTAQRIRAHLSQVDHLRGQVNTPGMANVIAKIKQLQSLRFRTTYADFLASPRYESATRFFLEELYGEHDFTLRDAQFARTAGAIERLFPEAVGQLAVDLAETHALSERLDHEMGEQWASLGGNYDDSMRYVLCWRATDQRQHRNRQLAVVLHMGQELQRLTRTKSLLIALKMMRKPAQLADLSSLQHFLERGFVAFAAMGNASAFLTAIEVREATWIAGMFDSDLKTCAQQLARELASLPVTQL
jgi:hypothetical protein